MTNEELERATTSIIEWQKIAAEHIARLASKQTEHNEVMAKLASRQVEHDENIALLASRQVEHDENMSMLSAGQVEHDERIARFERSYIAIANLLQKHDGQLDALTDGLNRLTQAVERYITTRGNGSGNGQQ